MGIYNKPRIIIFSIKGSTITRFVLIDIFFSTTIYFVVNMISSSLIVATIGSIIGTEGVKKLRRPKAWNVKYSPIKLLWQDV